MRKTCSILFCVTVVLVLGLASKPPYRPAKWMECPEPTCSNDKPMGPVNWFVDRNYLDVEYRCTNCGCWFIVKEKLK